MNVLCPVLVAGVLLLSENLTNAQTRVVGIRKPTQSAVYAQAKISINIPACTSRVMKVWCRENAHVALYDSEGIGFVHAGLCADSDYPALFIRPCYQFTTQRVVIKLPVHVLPGEKVWVKMWKRGEHMVLEWSTSKVTERRELRYVAGWRDSKSKSYSRVMLTSSGSLNPPAVASFQNVYPAGGALRVSDPIYSVRAISPSAWKFQKGH